MSKAEEKQTVRDATDSFYEWIHGKTMPGLRPSPKQCYEAGYNNALAGIPNPEAVRELVEACQSAAENGAMCEWVRPFVAALGEVPAVRHDAIRELIEAATELRQKFNHVALTRLYAAVESLSAPSTGAQQK